MPPAFSFASSLEKKCFSVLMCSWRALEVRKVWTRVRRRRLSMRSMIQTCFLPNSWPRSVSDGKGSPARALMTYLPALSDRCWDRRDVQVPTQPLQARQLLRRPSFLDAFDVVFRQSFHVVFLRLPILLAVLLPASPSDEMFPIFDQGGLWVWLEVFELSEIGLFCHAAKLVRGQV